MAEMRLVVVGAAGRMGRMLIRAVIDDPGCRLVGAVERSGSVALGEDAGLIAGAGRACVDVTDDIDAACAEADGILDFTAPHATLAFAEVAARRGLVHVVGTTGLGPDDFGAARGGEGGPRPVRQHVSGHQFARRTGSEGGPQRSGRIST